jgi:hypothetical protein
MHVEGEIHTQSVRWKMQQILGSLLTHLHKRASIDRQQQTDLDSIPKHSGKVKKQLSITQHIPLDIYWAKLNALNFL